MSGKARRPFVAVLFVLLAPMWALASEHVAMHYSYSGNDPGGWRREVLVPDPIPAATDFTVFPCGAVNCTVAQVVTDFAGNTYAAGSRYFGGFNSDVFVVKLDRAGQTVFLVTFGGKGEDRASGIAVDPAGDIIVGGLTGSPNFPLWKAIQTTRSSYQTGFLVKLSSDGQLFYSTYFGGATSDSSVSGVAADAAGNAYVTGSTRASDFPTTTGLPANITTATLGGITGAFVAKLSASGDRIVYSGVIAGTALNCIGGSACAMVNRSAAGVAIGLDISGNAYVAGNANVTDLPSTPGALLLHGQGPWVARINASGQK
jgi:hypothetical protein